MVEKEQKQELEIWLGKDKLNKKIFWNPTKERNQHLVLIGGSGSGKTETIRCLLFELKENKIPSIIFDFHDDFKKLSDNLITLENSTINPLEVQLGEKPLDVVYKVAKILSNLFGFGEIQESTIRDAIKEYYEDSGVKDLKEPNLGKYKLIPFSKFKNLLEGKAKDTSTRNMLAKLDVLFDTDLFMKATDTSLPFNTMLQKVSVIDLHKYPTEEIKSLIAEILIRNLINYCYLEGKSEGILKLFCVIDEAHRVTYEGSPIDMLLRESRKYGIGCILASQRPEDFSETILANIGTAISFQASLPKDIRALSEILGVNKEDIQNLSQPGDCYIKFASSNTSTKLHITQAIDRPRFKEILDKFNEKASKEASEKELEKLRIEKKEKEDYLSLKEKYPELEKQLKANLEKLSLLRKDKEENALLKEKYLEIEKQYKANLQKLSQLKIAKEEIDKENKKAYEMKLDISVLNKQLKVAEEKIIKLEADIRLERQTLKDTNKKEKENYLKMEKTYSAKLQEIKYALESSIYGKLLKNKIDFSVHLNKDNFCKKCGNDCGKDNRFCENCGEVIK